MWAACVCCEAEATYEGMRCLGCQISCDESECKRKSPMRRRERLEQEVLQVLQDAQEPMSGYMIAKATGRMAGTTQPILTRLEADGHLRAWWESPHHGRRPRRMYALRREHVPPEE